MSRGFFHAVLPVRKTLDGSGNNEPQGVYSPHTRNSRCFNGLFFNMGVHSCVGVQDNGGVALVDALRPVNQTQAIAVGVIGQDVNMPSAKLGPICRCKKFVRVNRIGAARLKPAVVPQAEAGRSPGSRKPLAQCRSCRR